MANIDRSRFEVLRRRSYPTTGADVINQGDQLFDSSGNARPITAAATADAIADTFIGIALNAKRADEQPEILVGVDLVAEMDLTTAISGSAIAIGTEVEPVIDTGAGVPQQVVVGSSNPIGKVAKIGRIGDLTLTCHFVGKSVASPVVAD